MQIGDPLADIGLADISSVIARKLLGIKALKATKITLVSAVSVNRDPPNIALIV